MSKSRLLVVACLAFLAVALPGRADEAPLSGYERDGPTTVLTVTRSDPCLFFRGQTYERSIQDFQIDMLLACEEIARRRAAGLRPGDRLTAAEAMLNTYRQAVVTAGTEAFDRRLRAGRAPWLLGLSGEEKYAIAEATGVLLVLESIRNGF